MAKFRLFKTLQPNKKKKCMKKYPYAGSTECCPIIDFQSIKMVQVVGDDER